MEAIARVVVITGMEWLSVVPLLPDSHRRKYELDPDAFFLNVWRYEFMREVNGVRVYARGGIGGDEYDNESDDDYDNNTEFQPAWDYIQDNFTYTEWHKR